MPADPSLYSALGERTTPQRMSATKGLPIEKLHPSGRQTVAGMVAKGWIERRPDGWSPLLHNGSRANTP
jgi:hypothetical protein